MLPKVCPICKGTGELCGDQQCWNCKGSGWDDPSVTLELPLAYMQHYITMLEKENADLKQWKEVAKGWLPTWDDDETDDDSYAR